MSNNKSVEIGCLLKDFTFKAGAYKIFPSSHFDEQMGFYKKTVNEDHYVYPPTIIKCEIDPITNKITQVFDNTKKPSDLHRPISTHIIHRTDNTDLDSDFRTNDGALILRLLDVLYETTTQFNDWWWSGRILLKKENFDWLNQSDFDKLYFEAFSEWCKWNLSTKQVFINCCFNFSRSMTYEWDYERFTFLYICIDALWWIAENGYNVKCSGGHGKRINAILKHFKLHENNAIVKNIVDIRNDLFHQGIWGVKKPIHSWAIEEYSALRYLHEIVRRCIFRIVGIQSTYINSNWETYLDGKLWNR